MHAVLSVLAVQTHVIKDGIQTIAVISQRFYFVIRLLHSERPQHSLSTHLQRAVTGLLKNVCSL